jgi:hypothetical protein
MFQPYLFVLKEGSKIKKDFLDYSLMMLMVHARETIESPGTLTTIPPSQQTPLPHP